VEAGDWLSDLVIRPAVAADHAAILGIWNPVIRDTTIIFAAQERDVAGLAALIAERRAAWFEFFVALDAEGLRGFASYAQFRGGDGYRTAMEHTVMLAPDARGRGIGRALVSAVEAHARTRDAHTMHAGISGENAAGIAFHERIGYRTVAVVPEVGRKFGRFLDLVLMQKRL